jgi:hypothetical protein
MPRLRQCGPVAVSDARYDESVRSTLVSGSLKPLVKAVSTTSSCWRSIMPGVVANMRNAVSRWPASGAWLEWNNAPSKSFQLSPLIMSASARVRDVRRTFFAVLARNLGDGVGYLVPDVGRVLSSQCLQELLADGISLGLGDGEEDLLAVLGVGVLARARGDAPEQDRGEGASLAPRNQRHYRRPDQETGRLDPRRMDLRWGLRRR